MPLSTTPCVGGTSAPAQALASRLHRWPALDEPSSRTVPPDSWLQGRARIRSCSGPSALGTLRPPESSFNDPAVPSAASGSKTAPRLSSPASALVFTCLALDGLPQGISKGGPGKPEPPVAAHLGPVELSLALGPGPAPHEPIASVSTWPCSGRATRRGGSCGRLAGGDQISSLRTPAPVLPARLAAPKTRVSGGAYDSSLG